MSFVADPDEMRLAAELAIEALTWGNERGLLWPADAPCEARLGGFADGLPCTLNDGHAAAHWFVGAGVPQPNDTEAVQ